MYITASLLYNYIQCPHRVWRDVYGPKEEKDPEANEFVKLLWEKGIRHEDKIIRRLGEFLDLGEGTHDERFQKTLYALKNKTPLIYQGVLKFENLLGIPDLLKLLPDGTYIPVDIKSGMGVSGADEETGDEGKPKKHYAVQLCLYNDLLKKLGFAAHNSGKIIDIDGDEVEYNLIAPMGVRNKVTWWEEYEKIKKHVEFLISNQHKNKPAMTGICKLCPWYVSCKKWCEENRDLTNIFYVGRRVRDAVNEDLLIEKVDDFMEINVEEVMKQKEQEKKNGNKDFLYGLAAGNLQKAINRAKILYQTKKPVAYSPILFPEVSHELFFDIEDDPTQEFVYMHGVYERNGKNERFLHFTAKELSKTAEKEAWKNFWSYIGSLPKDNFAVYYYSPHEKTTYRRLQKRYPDVISAENLEAFFENPNAIDLYNIIQRQTDWPIGNYSLKTLATYLGFKWRDATPSGALSIQWFNEYLDKNDPKILERILLYNEDDCKATMVVKDAMQRLDSSTVGI